MKKENILDMKVDIDTSLVTEKLHEIEMTVNRITEKIGYLKSLFGGCENENNSEFEENKGRM